ncbi:hypothetical protein GCM10022225_47070 [Plantactinospora mayteni]|uniref:Uncharacterized protein n=1 Tax=Plantactinospora mayteni TaxID=566021 RepID=A0ABQ4EX80_9ACTN|nr:hypothetical protein [Plantactinospora mayteni]GIG99214.1 hypothetical protein Pma05_57870 [Plantactinospora mayteni]
MVGFIGRQPQARPGRPPALLADGPVAATGLVAPSGTIAVTTSQLHPNGQVRRETRAAYDILVRPNRTQPDPETARGVVRPDHLSGLFGGISMAQYERVRTLGGVADAATAATRGHSLPERPAPFDRSDKEQP